MKKNEIPAMRAGGERLLLGHPQLCLNVKSLRASLAFYAKLGFRRVGGNPKHGYAILRNGSWQLGLFQGHIAQNLVNFRGGNVKAICAALKRKKLALRQDATGHDDGGVDALLLDPDGNVTYFDTMPRERLG